MLNTEGRRLGGDSLSEINPNWVPSVESEREKHARRDSSQKIRAGGCEVVRGKNGASRICLLKNVGSRAIACDPAQKNRGLIEPSSSETSHSYKHDRRNCEN